MESPPDHLLHLFPGDVPYQAGHHELKNTLHGSPQQASNLDRPLSGELYQPVCNSFRLSQFLTNLIHEFLHSG
jgi:hypothetical protein